MFICIVTCPQELTYVEQPCLEAVGEPADRHAIKQVPGLAEQWGGYPTGTAVADIAGEPLHFLGVSGNPSEDSGIPSR